MSLLIIAHVIFPLCLRCVFASTMIGESVGLLKGRKKKRRKGEQNRIARGINAVSFETHHTSNTYMSSAFMLSPLFTSDLSVYGCTRGNKTRGTTMRSEHSLLHSLREKGAFPEMNCRPDSSGNRGT